MYNIEIEDGIPLPAITAGRMRYPWDKLQPGQSFFIPGATESRVTPKKLREQGWKFTSAVEETHYGERGRRYWRVE